MDVTLAIADRMYSSWSLRGWLSFEAFGLPVAVRHAPMGTPAFAATLAEFAPARTVPAFRAGEIVATDSLAIAETLAEAHPEIPFWPAAPRARALARSLVAEMHSGFAALRAECPMNLRHVYEIAPSDAVRDDLARLAALWAAARAVSGSEGWLFGTYSLADVFFAPVAARIAGYALPVGAADAAYVARHLADPAFRRWRAMGVAEGRILARYERDAPTRPWPGPPTLPAQAATDATPENRTCPYSGRPVAADSLAVFDGGRVIGFCNPFCRDKSVADPLAWPALAAMLADS